MKKSSIHFKIGFILILAVILLSVTCYLLYTNLSSIVASIRIDVNPELRLLSIRDISMDLEKAGNSVRIYTITRDPSDIKLYYRVISNIDDKVSKLRSECINDPVLLAQTDTISRLIEENILIWNELLVLYNDDQVTAYLKHLSDQMDSVSVSSQKKGILKRVFSRRPESPIDNLEIMDDLDKIVRQDSATRDEIISRESQLAFNSSEIREKFNDLITKMENEVFRTIEAKADAAGKIAARTYRWLIMFSISGGLLAVLILFIIVRYTRRAYAYQEALERSKNEAENLSRTKELFIANMSHEIRTPVTAISGFAEQLLKESADETTNRSLEIIKSSSDHLIRIIDDILDFSKLQNNKLVLEKVHFSIAQLLEEVYRLFEKQAEKNNISLSYSLNPDTPPVLAGDPYRLKQIMINLVGNSVKFTKNGTVQFNISSIKKDWGAIELVMEFSDTGIGVDESRSEIIFEDFTQAEMSTTRKYGGTGLGLSIVKKLIDLHKGSIDFKSKKNQGTVIICRIPYMTGDETQISKDAGHTVLVPDEISGMKILIVDDEEYNRLLFRKILDRWNVRCQEVSNGMDALETLKAGKFDMLFLDLRMPGIDGINTAQFIRNEMNIPGSEMPIIFISAAPLNEDIRKYRNAGMDAFLQKPFTEEKLLATILSVLDKNIHPVQVNKDTYENDTPLTGNRISLKNLYHISGGDEEFVRQMVESFISTTGRGLSEMNAAVSSGQFGSVGHLAHKMLSPCRHIGATDLYNLLVSIEKNAVEKINPEMAEILTMQSLKEFESVCDILRRQLKK